MNNRTALLLPTYMECRAVRRCLRAKRLVRIQGVSTWHVNGLWILQSGMGPNCIQRCMPVLQELDVQDVWLAGWCGGLVPEVRCGDIVVPDCVVSENGNSTPLVKPAGIDAVVCNVASTCEVTVHSGPVLSTNRLIHDEMEKRSLENAIAVEMEALAMVEWSAENGKRFFHLRVVLDPVDTTMPGGTFWKFLSFAKQAKNIVRFFRNARRANHVLAKLMETVLKEELFGR